MEGLHVVWFKRDLRVHDHVPLLEAAGRGPVLPLYIAEPQLWCQPDASARQWAFLAEALLELRQALAELGQPLLVRVGEVVPLLERLRRRAPIAGLWSHEETGNGWTYQRDRAVAAWCRQHGIAWHESPQNGVVRRLQQRDGWMRRRGPGHPDRSPALPSLVWLSIPARAASAVGAAPAWSCWRASCVSGAAAMRAGCPAR